MQPRIQQHMLIAEIHAHNVLLCCCGNGGISPCSATLVTACESPALPARTPRQIDSLVKTLLHFCRRASSSDFTKGSIDTFQCVCLGLQIEPCTLRFLARHARGADSSASTFCLRAPSFWLKTRLNEKVVKPHHSATGAPQSTVSRLGRCPNGDPPCGTSHTHAPPWRIA